jgi:hypothetical protein
MVASTQAQGLAVPDFGVLCAYHPQVALAIACGVPLHPNVRVLQVTFGTGAAVGDVLPASFSEVMGAYSIFAGADVTIDPTNAFPGNPLKYLNDVCQALCSGITFTLFCRGREDYTPIPDETPLQSVAKLLSSSVGIWTMDTPDNVKATFTLQSLPNAQAETTGFPLTAWVNLSFLMLGGGCREYLCLDPCEARRRLWQDHGIGQGGGMRPGPTPNQAQT